MKFRTLTTVAVLASMSFNFTAAAELAGTWTSEFDSQIGLQKYVYTFAVEGDKITGKAAYDHSMGKGESQLKNIKLENDTIAFTETLSLDGMELVITYSGKISADQMDLKRVVGDFATEQIVAKRAKPQAESTPPATK
jgi:hypothetical protein